MASSREIYFSNAALYDLCGLVLEFKPLVKLDVNEIYNLGWEARCTYSKHSTGFKMRFYDPKNFSNGITVKVACKLMFGTMMEIKSLLQQYGNIKGIPKITSTHYGVLYNELADYKNKFANAETRLLMNNTLIESLQRSLASKTAEYRELQKFVDVNMFSRIKSLNDKNAYLTKQLEALTRENQLLIRDTENEEKIKELEAKIVALQTSYLEISEENELTILEILNDLRMKRVDSLRKSSIEYEHDFEENQELCQTNIHPLVA